MTSPSDRSFPATPVLTYLARRSGDSWSPWAECSFLLPVYVHEQVAPRWPRAELEFAPSNSTRFPWDLSAYCSIDDHLRITTGEAKAEDRTCLFEGFIAEHRTQFDGARATVHVSANSHAFRLRRDVALYGQHRWSYLNEDRWDAVTHYTGLPLQFNPGGRPNRHPHLYTGGNFPPDSEHPDMPQGVSAFCEPGSTEAKFWNWAQAFDYLQWHWNPDQKWCLNALLLQASYDDKRPLTIPADFTGGNLWDALCRIARFGGRDLYEELTASVSAEDETQLAVDHQLTLVAYGQGTAATVKLQGTGRSGNREQVRPEKTNLFAGTITVESAGSVTTPIIAGGRSIHEITVRLYPAWDPALYDASIVPFGKVSLDQTWSDYVRRYYTDGALFHVYRDVGRLWVANTAGRDLSGNAALDLALLCGEAAGSWPLMDHQPLSLLDDGPGETSAPAYAEISFDAGSTWQKLTACQVLPDRLGVRITAPNLADVVRLQANATDYVNTLFDNLWAKLATVQIRLVCCVASPNRTLAKPERRAGGGSVFEQRAILDREAVYQVRKRGATSPFREEGFTAFGESDGTAGDGRTIDQEAKDEQDADEPRQTSAMLGMEWIDTEIGLTDVVEKIEGIELPLKDGAGDVRRKPRVVAIRRDLRAMSQQLVLDSDREALTA